MSAEIIQKIAAEDLKLELSVQKIGHRLRTLKLQRKQTRVGGVKGRYIVWDNRLMHTLAKRYCPDINEYADLFLPEKGN